MTHSIAVAATWAARIPFCQSHPKPSYPFGPPQRRRDSSRNHVQHGTTKGDSQHDPVPGVGAWFLPFGAWASCKWIKTDDISTYFSSHTHLSLSVCYYVCIQWVFIIVEIVTFGGFQPDPRFGIFPRTWYCLHMSVNGCRWSKCMITICILTSGRSMAT